MLSRMKRKLWRAVVRAIPTCKLWRAEYHMDAYTLRVWPHWQVSDLEVVEA